MKMKEFGPPREGGRPWHPPWIRQWVTGSYMLLLLTPQVLLTLLLQILLKLQYGKVRM